MAISELTHPLQNLDSSSSIRFESLGLMPYAEAFALQQKMHEERRLGQRADTVLLLEHPRVITKGRRLADQDFRVPPERLLERGFAIEEGHRGGTLTYHGPGQRVIYFIFSLEALGLGIPQFVKKIERALIHVLANFQIQADSGKDEPGIWVQDRKIASLGLSVNRGVSMHGAALNVSPDLKDFEVIVPCGIFNCKMTSMHVELHRELTMKEIDESLSFSILKEFLGK